MTCDVNHLLIVEDDHRVADGLRRNLELEDFVVAVTYSGEDGLEAVARAKPSFDLVILDVMLPGIDGVEVCRRLRRSGNLIPVLFLTARGSDADRILGLETGADDYLPKPFNFEELVLRIRGILRRAAWSSTPASTGSSVTIGDSAVQLDQLHADTPRGRVSLTEREVMLVRFFAENPGRVISRGELLERVWGYSFDTSTRTLDTFIHRLRKHFESDPKDPRHFHTVRGVGYRFTPHGEG